MQETQHEPLEGAARAAGLDAPFAIHRGKVVSRGNLWSDARELSERLPDRPYMVNLCGNRYLFCVALLAAAHRGQTSLLPPSAQAGAVKEIVGDYPGAYLACDRGARPGGLEGFAVEAPGPSGRAEAIELDGAALVAFTSGTTGRPKPCAHSFGTFRISAGMAARRLGFARRRLLMVSTTPPQHMYGLETSVFWPLFSELVLHDGRPFFPEDIRRAVGAGPWPAVLASTPAHLRPVALAGGRWRGLAAVLSATDALSERLARDIKAATGVCPREIYGSTETLSFASRAPLREGLWLPYAGVRLGRDAEGRAWLASPHLREAVGLQDRLEIGADGRFAVLGRPADMVKVGGKRASLAELDRRLRDLDGVEDGFCFVLDGGRGEPRLAAVVVSRLDAHGIRQGLRPYLDEVFLPRKVHFVAAIPRNAAGKLVKAEVEALLAGLA